MSEIKNKPINARPCSIDGRIHYKPQVGITMREHFSISALQGIICGDLSDLTEEHMVEMAVRMADKLLAELERKYQ